MAEMNRMHMILLTSFCILLGMSAAGAVYGLLADHHVITTVNVFTLVFCASQLYVWHPRSWWS